MTLLMDVQMDGWMGVSQYPRFFFEKHGDKYMLTVVAIVDYGFPI